MKVGDKYRILNAEQMGLADVYKNGDIVTIVSVDSMEGGTDVRGWCYASNWPSKGYLGAVGGYVKNPTRVMYCVDDVIAAAKYLRSNNAVLDQEPEEIYQNIIRDMHLCVKEDWEKTSVGGYTVTKSYISDDLYECSITVSPNFDLDLVYTTEEVI